MSKLSRWIAPSIFTALICTALTLLVIAAPAQAGSRSCAHAEAQPSVLSGKQYDVALLCLLNRARAGKGLAPLKPNPRLASAAFGHSTSMATRSYLAHTEPDGLTFAQRVQRSGYQGGARHWIAGENVGMGSDLAGTPQAMVSAFMNSPEHRRNILNGAFRDIGIGIVRSAPPLNAGHDGITITTDFGRRVF
jgi:uncharacterized protein YkwD